MISEKLKVNSEKVVCSQYRALENKEIAYNLGNQTETGPFLHSKCRSLSYEIEIVFDVLIVLILFTRATNACDKRFEMTFK